MPMLPNSAYRLHRCTADKYAAIAEKEKKEYDDKGKGREEEGRRSLGRLNCQSIRTTMPSE